jgi:hypothetical protein
VRRVCGILVPRDVVDDGRADDDEGEGEVGVAGEMGADEGDVGAGGDAAERDARWVDVEPLRALRVGVLQRREGVLDADRERVFGDETVADVDDADVGLDAEVFADVCFCVEVAEAPAWLRLGLSVNWRQGHTAAVEINMYRPRPWRERLVDPDGDLFALVAGDGGVVDPGAVWRRACAVGVEHGVLGPQDRQVDRASRRIGYILVVEPDELRVEVREDRGMDGVEGFVRHDVWCILQLEAPIKMHI